MQSGRTFVSFLGTNKFASQKGMTIGGVRHVADIKVTELCQEAQAVLTLQSG